MIKLQVIGNLGKDCVVNNVNGNTVINFSVAHTEKFKDRSGVQQSKTTWVNCSYWTERTAIAPFLLKGTMVYVEGVPFIKVYQLNNTPTGSQELKVTNVQLLGKPQQQPQSQANYTEQAQQHLTNPNDLTEPLDDLPF